MTDDPPVGALSEAERRELVFRYREDSKNSGGCDFNDRVYFAVCKDGDFRRGKRFCFEWTPPYAYYFTNYFLAYGYLLRVKAKSQNHE